MSAKKSNNLIIVVILTACLAVSGFVQTASAQTSKPLLEENSQAEEMRDIIDIKPLEELGINYKRWAMLLGILILLALIIWGIVCYRRKKNGVVKEEIIIKRPAHEIALEGLYRLQKTNFFGPDEIKKIYFELSEIFRFYLEERYGFPASDWTSQEIAAYLNKLPELPFDIRNQANLFLVNTDLVKFAEHVPENTQVKAELQRAVQFVEATREVQTEDTENDRD